MHHHLCLVWTEQQPEVGGEAGEGEEGEEEEGGIKQDMLSGTSMGVSMTAVKQAMQMTVMLRDAFIFLPFYPSLSSPPLNTSYLTFTTRA
jgi:hypothetical protein